MIDLRAARNEPDRFRVALARKGAAERFDALLAADERWRALVPWVDELRAKPSSRARNASAELLDTPTAANSRKNGSDFTTHSRSANRCRRSAPSTSSAPGSPIATSLVGGRSSQRRRSPTVCRWMPWKSAYRSASGVTRAT